MRSLCRRFALVIAAATAGLGESALADGKPDVVWEYRVVTKDQVLDMGKKDLAAGLNLLGREGWDLVVVDGSYIFKRPKLSHDKEIAELRLSLSLIRTQREQAVERLAWSERMLKKGYMSEAQVAADRAKLQEYDLILEKTRKELEMLVPPPPAPKPLDPKEGKP